MNGPPETIGAALANVVSALPLPVAYFAQMCSGRIGTCWSWDSTLDTGCLYVTTRVVAFGAVALAMCAVVPAELAVGPLANFRMVLNVQAASAAVSGFPSDHLAFGWVWNVQVRPSALSCQLRAKSGTNWSFWLYWTRYG